MSMGCYGFSTSITMTQIATPTTEAMLSFSKFTTASRQPCTFCKGNDMTISKGQRWIGFATVNDISLIKRSNPEPDQQIQEKEKP